MYESIHTAQWTQLWKMQFNFDNFNLTKILKQYRRMYTQSADHHMLNQVEEN